MGRLRRGAIVALAGFFPACALTPRLDMQEVQVVTHSSRIVLITDVRVVQEDGATLIKGRLVRRDNRRVVGGALTAEAHDTTDKLLTRNDVPYFFRRSRAHVARFTTFATRVPLLRPGATVVLMHSP